METIDIIRQLCKSKGLTVTQLENELDYGNGSLAKSKNMSADRMYQIAKYFGVSMEYLMTGKTLDETDDEMAILRQQQSILLEINKTSQAMADFYKKIAECQDQIDRLKKEYTKLETQRNPVIASTEEKTLLEANFNIFDNFPSNN